MKLTKEHLKRVQIEQFYAQLAALDKEEKELEGQVQIARNLACSEWEYGPVLSPCGGRDGLRTVRMVAGASELLRKNLDKHRDDISYRRYALIKTYRPVLKIDGRLKDCYDFWERKTEI